MPKKEPTFTAAYADYFLLREEYIPFAAALVGTGYFVSSYLSYKVKKDGVKIKKGGPFDPKNYVHVRMANELRRVGTTNDGTVVGVSVNLHDRVVGIVDGGTLTVTGSFTKPTELLAAVADAETRALAILVSAYITEQNG